MNNNTTTKMTRRQLMAIESDEAMRREAQEAQAYDDARADRRGAHWRTLLTTAR
jgi:hypothetical protein